MNKEVEDLIPNPTIATPELPPSPTPQTPSTDPMPSGTHPIKQTNKWLVFFLTIFDLILIGSLCFFAYQSSQQPGLKYSSKHAAVTAPLPTPVITPSPYPTIEFISDPVPSDWRSVTDELLGIELKIPRYWEIEEDTSSPSAIKTLYLSSPDFKYKKNELDTVESGSKVNITLDEGKQYQSFAQFLRNKSLGSGFYVSTINGANWFYSDYYASTPYEHGVLEVSLKTANTNDGAIIFNQILSTITFSSDSPATTEKQIGYIKSISPKSDVYEMQIDFIDFIQDPTAWDGYRIDNPSTDLATLPVRMDAEITFQTYSHFIEANIEPNQSIGLKEFLALFDSMHPTIVAAPYWIETENGTVVKIQEQYLP